MIIDLRDNPGGVLGTVVDMLDNMLPKGTIVYTKDKNGKGETYSSSGDHEFKLPLVVLVNGNSASASEIFTGAVKDYGIGTIVGTTTFGKGIVQKVFSLNDGSAVKLTIPNTLLQTVRVSMEKELLRTWRSNTMLQNRREKYTTRIRITSCKKQLK